MQDQSEDNVGMLKRFLSDQGFEVEETENGVNLRLESGHLVDIYALMRDSDVFWASVETKATDAERRYLEMEAIRDTLFKGLEGIAVLGEFKESKKMDDRFIYVADVEINNAVAYHGMIMLGEGPAGEKPAGKIPDHVATPQAPPPPLDEVKPSPRTDAERALEQLESVDGKMLRQGLDMMNLRRSSNVRLALTRIFRSAVSEEELTLAIKAEAKKIVSPDDRKELEMVKLLSTNGFLEPVVELLCREVFRKH